MLTVMIAASAATAVGVAYKEDAGLALQVLMWASVYKIQISVKVCVLL